MNASALFLSDSALCLASAPIMYWLLWGGSLALTVTLVVLLLTKWGHSQPLHKCALLSLIVHMILAFLTMTVRIVNGDGSGGGGGGGGSPIHVRIVEDSTGAVVAAETSRKVAAAAAPRVSEITPPALLEPPAEPEVAKVEPPSIAESRPQKAEKSAEAVAPEVVAAPKNDPAKQIVERTKQETKTESAPKPELTVVATEPPALPPAPSGKAVAAAVESGKAVHAESTPTTAAKTTSDIAVDAVSTVSSGNIYSLRNAPGRLGLVVGQGGNAETEAAVASALHWLAAAQSKDGRWDAVQFGAGHEEMSLGQNRGGAGQGADTGITALALLAFLGAGQSHVQGEFQDTVRRGLDFLLRTQAADGSVFGEATLYAQMYCHSMATFALAEAQALTKDRRLEPAVLKAVNYSLAAQNSTTGGWRYRPGDTGDTSQLGWQMMALASAHRAGIKIPDQTWSRVARFLRSVERGTNGGLASYRADSPMSTSMTAEALYCRLVLEEMSSVNLKDPAATEATTQILATVPNVDRMNLYYWYYATLALHQRQNADDVAKDAWRKWNEALMATLTKSQSTDGSNAGSWESNQIWGGYGGRIYTTAMATMCLEVYYRYAPAQRRTTWSATRPQLQSIPR